MVRPICIATSCAALLAMMLVAAAPAASAETWQLGPAPSDQPGLMAARVTSADGHTLYVWQLSAREDEIGAPLIFGELHLGGGVRFGGEMPVYRIDGAVEVDTDMIRAAGDSVDALWGHVGEDVAFWRIASLPTAAGDAALAPWLTGREVAVVFTDADGIEQTIRFSLAGSAEAISGATGLAEN